MKEARARHRVTPAMATAGGLRKRGHGVMTTTTITTTTD